MNLRSEQKPTVHESNASSDVMQRQFRGITATLSGGANLREPVAASSCGNFKKHDYVKTKNCGVLDYGHMNPKNARELIEKVKRASDLLRMDTNISQFPADGVLSSHKQESKFRGITVNAFSTDFKITKPLTKKEVLSVAFGIFQHISRGFESQQSKLDPVKRRVGMSPSSFAAEDLPSNLVSFYRAARNWSPNDLLEICGCSFDLDKAPEGENRTFSPTEGTWPKELQEIVAEPQGKLWHVLTDTASTFGIETVNPTIQRKSLKVNTPGDKYEQAADRVAAEVMRMREPKLQRECSCGDCQKCKKKKKHTGQQIQRVANDHSAGIVAPPSVNEVVNSSGSPLPNSTRSFMESRFGEDFSDVRVHTDARAQQSASEVFARAYTVGNHIVFGRGENPDIDRKLLAHELTHTIQQSSRPIGSASSTVQRKTKGEETFDKSQEHLNIDAGVKKNVDVLKAALREIRKGKSVGFNVIAGRKRIDSIAKLLKFSVKRTNAIKAEWAWLTRNGGAKSYKRKREAFFDEFTTPIEELGKKHPKSHTKYWLRNTPANIFDVVHETADSTISAEELYTFAAHEGLIDIYIRPQTGVGSGNPTIAQLSSVVTSNPISGFQALGLDDFMTDMSAKRYPLTDFQPKTFDASKLKEIREFNEEKPPREVRSAEFPNLKMALQGLVMMMKRRRALFLDDAKKFGYGKASPELLVYFTYLYYNPGEFAGKKTLRDNKGTRKLPDWPKTKFFPGARKVLNDYRMVKATKVF